MKTLVSSFRSLLAIGVVLLVLAVLEGCKPSVPHEYIQPDELEDILYDYHVADGMAALGGSDGEKALAYRTAVLKKYGVSQADFDSSMVYYMRHTDRLHDIYEHLSKRLSEESKDLGASASDIARYGGTAATGDTASVWQGDKFLVLASQIPFNYSSFTIPCDTSCRAGDLFDIDFDANFFFQDGMRDGVLVLAMTLADDSIVTRDLRIINNGHFSLQIADESFKGVKSLKGYFLLNTGMTNRNSTTMRMMFIENVRMIRLHRKQNIITPAKVDSLRRLGQPDSNALRPQPVNVKSQPTYQLPNS